MADTTGIEHPQNDFDPLAVSVFEEIYNTVISKLPGFQNGPFKVIYGRLTIDENRERGGHPFSRHLVGKAIDIQASPNSNERKMVVASIAEHVIKKRKLGSEIAIKWGLNGHVHIAVMRQQGIHKRFSIGKGKAWTLNDKDNIRILNKMLKKYKG